MHDRLQVKLRRSVQHSWYRSRKQRMLIDLRSKQAPAGQTNVLTYCCRPQEVKHEEEEEESTWCLQRWHLSRIPWDRSLEEYEYAVWVALSYQNFYLCSNVRSRESGSAWMIRGKVRSWELGGLCLGVPVQMLGVSEWTVEHVGIKFLFVIL